MRHVHKIKLVPADGPTLLSTTKLEWEHGQTFKVIWCDSPVFNPGSYITISEVQDQETYAPVEFRPEFEYLSVGEHISQQAEADHGYTQTAQYASFLTNKLTRGQ